MKNWILFLLFSSPFCLTAQNLVPNPGFEEIFACPSGAITVKSHKPIAPHWYPPSYGTPDLYNTCNTYNMGIQNITGVTRPFAGNGFAGIITWEKNGYREYLQVKLIDSLKSGQKYVVSFRYKLSSYSMYAADRICAAFSDSLKLFKNHFDIPITPVHCEVQGEAQENSGQEEDWQLLVAEFTAKGGEQYLTIGNFFNNIHTQRYHLEFRHTQEPMLQQAAYYYIDEVNVYKKIAPDTSSVVIGGQTVQLYETFIMKNISFDFDSDILQKSSFESLEELSNILKSHPELNIYITGHTDQNGTDEYNMDLSQRRTESVKKYLMQQGISGERIRTEGFGEMQPLEEGNDEKNRRVEIVFEPSP